MKKISEMIASIDRKAEGGLNQTTFGGAREFLKGIRQDCAEMVADAGTAIQALRLIRHAGYNTTEWSTWAQRMAAWGMEPDKWPKPDDCAPTPAKSDAIGSGNPDIIGFVPVGGRAESAFFGNAPPPASGQVTHTGPDGYQRVSQSADWMDCERISNIPTVHETIQTFADDQTADNATGMIQAIIEAHQHKAK